MVYALRVGVACVRTPYLKRLRVESRHLLRCGRIDCRRGHC